MRIVSLTVSLTFAISTAATAADFVVAADGGGDFTTVQAAIDAVPDFRKERTVIEIRPGIYHEKLVIPASKTQVTLRGDDPASTVLTYDDYAAKPNRFGEPMGTTGSSSTFLFADDFRAERLTFANDAGPVGQAVALRIDGDHAVFVDCHFRGHQDTLYCHGATSRQLFLRCTIEGTVDFIFGSSTAAFMDCDIVCKRGGAITAASTPAENAYGFVFRRCRVRGDAPAGSVYLGRPWRDHARVVWLDCHLADLVHPVGWHDWGRPQRQRTAFYAEYHSTGPGANPAARAAWSHQLTDDQAAAYHLQAVLGDWVGQVDGLNAAGQASPSLPTAR